MNPPFSAVLLAAGHSIRMRRDKALLEHEGRLMWQRQRDVLASAGAEEIFLSARSNQGWAESAEGFAAVVRDAGPDTGPLGGIVAGLDRCRHPQLAVLAVDLPQVTAAWFQSLQAECAPAGGRVGRRGNFFEPLAAIYPRDLLPLAHAAVEARELSLQKLISKSVAQGLMTVREISPEEAGLFVNWNEPVT
ncbi:MAG: hypothetical protein JWM88_3224 [Verrucomicrobia bacterium]|nr:hypothetical protein [Verrucomicrobiota bacterium]